VPTAKAQTRQRILDAAYGLFWRQGFMRVSMDQIAARAQLTKRTLYQHFSSKDALIAAALDHSSELAMRRLRDFPTATEPDELIERFFGQLADWAAKPRWSGGGFTRAVMELADLRGHPARAIARRHKAAVEKWMAEALAAGRVSQPRERACEVMLLMEGAMALMLIHGDRGYAKAAARAAKALVAKR
jgi:AcrR family transcriptional regulator